MKIVMVYHHHERILTNELGELLTKLGHTVTAAPLGWTVGSDKWKNEVLKDLKRADMVIALLTSKSIQDEWVLWRLYTAQQKGIPIIPVKMDEYNNDQLPAIFGDVRPIDLLFGPLSMTPPSAPEPENDPHNPPVSLSDTLCFISYAHEDEGFARRLTTDLKSQSIPVWRDKDDISPGMKWETAIHNALNRSTYVLFVASTHSSTSPEVGAEIGYALAKKKTIIPLILENCELTYRVYGLQWIDFQNNYEEGLHRLIAELTKEQPASIPKEEQQT